MSQIASQQDSRTEQSIHECPVCGRTQLHTQQASIFSPRSSAVIGNATMDTHGRIWVARR